MSRTRQSLVKQPLLSSCSSIFEPLEDRRMFSAAGTLDPSFSGDGKATIDFGGGITVNSAAATVQADGRTVVVGTSSDNRIALARFNIDGTVDTSFGADHTGKILIHAGGTGYMDHATCIMLDADGELVIGGYALVSTGPGYPYDSHAIIARYKTDGTPDTSFGKDHNNPGIVLTDFGGLAYCDVRSLATATNGKLLVGGEAYPDSWSLNQDMVVARMNWDGSFDGSFGDDGHRYIGLGQSERGQAMTQDLDGTPANNPLFGSIVIVGQTDDTDGFDDASVKLAVCRLTPNGSFDTSFDGDGRLSLSFPNAIRSTASAVTVESGDRIVIAGTDALTLDVHGRPHAQDFALVRLQPSGAIDSSFGPTGTGFVTTEIASENVANSMITSYNGELLVGGQAGALFALARYTTDGVLDSGFGDNGIVLADSGGISNLAVGPGRRFVATGGAAFHTDRFFDDGANLVYATAFLDPSASEAGQDPASFFVFRSERLPVATRVYLQVGGTATSPLVFPHINVDYTGISAPPPVVVATGPLLSATARPMFGLVGSSVAYVDIPANQTYAVVTITPIDDKLVEGDETATFSVMPNANYEVGTPQVATITIHDNDGAVLHDTADAYVKDGAAANSNFGGVSDLESKKNTTGTNRLSYLKFDLSSLNPATIGTVSLKLFGELNNTNQTNVATSVFGSNNTTWGENTITWNNKPATTGGALATTTIVNNTPQWYSWDITAYVKSQLAAGHKTITLVLQNGGTSDPFATFASKEAGVNAPQLVVANA
jgi:uncharacterized delta-60 repeat protein